MTGGPTRGPARFGRGEPGDAGNVLLDPGFWAFVDRPAISDMKNQRAITARNASTGRSNYTRPKSQIA